MDMKEAGRAVRPLKFAFWGGALVFFLPLPWSPPAFAAIAALSIIGTVLLIIGSTGLVAVAPDRRYLNTMRFARVVFVAEVLLYPLVLLVTVIVPDYGWGMVLLPAQAAFYAATIAFCVAMDRWCEGADLTSAAVEWSGTKKVGIGVFAAPAAWALVVCTRLLGRVSGFPRILARSIPFALSAVVGVYFLLATRNTIRTIMFLQAEERKEAESDGG